VKRAALLLAVAIGLLASACGDDSPTETTTTVADTMAARVYFIREGKIWPVSREIGTDRLPNSVLYEQLERGPTAEERALGFSTEVPADGSEAQSDLALAQITYTLTQSRTAPIAVPLGTVAYFYAGQFTRADFEEQTPSVLVESPLAYERVTTPLTVNGTANTFEANFQYELLDGEGNVVDENFVTATSGTGTRGTFDFTTAKVDDVSTLVVFEASAEDGSRMREVEIPFVDAS
jgi:hypothetical protein